MPYIRIVEEHEAEGRVKAAYDAGRQRAGGVANIIKMMSLDARSMQASMQFYVSLMKSPNALAPDKREMLATVVSGVNGCYY